MRARETNGDGEGERRSTLRAVWERVLYCSRTLSRCWRFGILNMVMRSMGVGVDIFRMDTGRVDTSCQLGYLESVKGSISASISSLFVGLVRSMYIKAQERLCAEVVF